jgi:hypothetical protein
VEGKTWTGFANSEEQYVDEYIGQGSALLDRGRGEEARQHELHRQQPLQAARRQGRDLITGQQQYSGAAAAALMIEALGQ